MPRQIQNPYGLNLFKFFSSKKVLNIDQGEGHALFCHFRHPVSNFRNFVDIIKIILDFSILLNPT